MTQDKPKTDPEATAPPGGDARYDAKTEHPLVEGFVPPRNHAVAAGEDTAKAEPVPSVVETATPRIAKGVADLDAERLDPNDAERARNVKERALAGHRAPDTIGTPEYKARLEDNAAALGGSPA
jgi:hypothetical protein